MKDKNKFIGFNAAEVPLEGSNLIEASAGTGKTYSIAILALRLIIEKNFSIKEILMVTFTTAAVAELQERIRLFIRSAHQVSNNETIDDAMITDLVNWAIKKSSREKIQRVLREAVAYLDETSVLTIHSFCQQTLLEFAFETNQLFGSELLQDTSAIIEDEVNKFWRKNITSIPVELLNALEPVLSRDSIMKILKEQLNGKRFSEYDHTQTYSICEDDYPAITADINKIIKKEKELRDCLVQYIVDNKKKIASKTATNSHAKKNILGLVDKPDEFIKAILKKRDAAYIIKIYEEELAMCIDCEKLMEEKDVIIDRLLKRIYCIAISEVSAGIKNFKQTYNQLSFDDLIANLHTALVKKENTRLVQALQKKYKAVFIDEFQDTDRLQYEIFKQGFGKGTVLFYIGDPKQSIYGWRKADIFTYFKAYNDVKYRYGMNENFRSSKSFIQAMNVFFQPVPGFDTFYFPKDEQAITYIPVNSPGNNTKGELHINGMPCVTIAVNTHRNKDDIKEAVTGQVIDLLSNKGYQVINNKERNIIPSDIGILVRSNKEAAEIKDLLAGYGIPAVTISDAKVLQSEEAKLLLYVLEAMMDISRSAINRALLSPFTGYVVKDILSLNDETAIELFKKYKTIWEEDGIYTALLSFINDFGVQQVLLKNNSENGERVITNLFQLVELLYKVQTTKTLLPLELVDWLKRGIGEDAEGDEYEQRVENDEESVKIVTIHKSKGLEYNIVLAPFLDLTESTKEVFCSLRLPATGEYIYTKKDQLSEEHKTLYSAQTEQENRRLLYVAITRAVYKCYLYRNEYYKASTLAVFINSLKDADPKVIEKIDPLPIPQNYFYNQSKPVKVNKKEVAVHFSLLHNNWARLSYTMLAAEMEKGVKARLGSFTNQYDHFIFNQLVKGNTTGNMLHFIFENMHFTNTERWAGVIDKAITRFAPAYRDVYESKLQDMLQQVLNVTIKTGDISFTLSEVGYDKRVHEFEFDFPVALFRPSLLNDLSGEKLMINVKSRMELEGIMNGKIDMLFECKGKYFVLDWKSTYLGDRQEDYSPPALDEAMNENNYHLQYLIYTLAAKKYLESRLTGFDYERDFGGVLYLFVRGMREGSDSGVYYCKPSLAHIDKLDRMLSEKLLVAYR